MASYQDDELQTLGDILPRMKPLSDPPPGASEEEQTRTQQHNEALAQLQDNALVARHLARSTIANGVPFPDSLLHFVPGRLVEPLAAARTGGNSDPWTDPSSTRASDNSPDPWLSYAKSAFTNPNPERIPRPPATMEKGPAGYYTYESPVDVDVARAQPESGLANAEKWLQEPYSVDFTTGNRGWDQKLGSGYVEKASKA